MNLFPFSRLMGRNGLVETIEDDNLTKRLELIAESISSILNLLDPSQQVAS